jgi:signal transduction histidine kinase
VDSAGVVGAGLVGGDVGFVAVETARRSLAVMGGESVVGAGLERPGLGCPGLVLAPVELLRLGRAGVVCAGLEHLGLAPLSSTPRLPLRARALIAAVVAAGGAALALRATEVVGWSRDDALWFGLLVVLVVVAEQFQLPFQRGSETHNFNLTDAVWTAGLVLAEPGVLTLAVGAGVLAGESLKGWSPLKIAFNVGQFVVGITAATLVYDQLGAGALDEPRTWAVTAVAMSAFFLVNTAAVGAVIAFVQGVSVASVIMPTLPLGALNWAANVALGTLAGVVWHVDPLGLPLLAAPLAVAFVAYRGWLWSMRERERMAEMARVADEIAAGRQLDRRLPEQEPGEATGALAHTLNHMLDRVELAFARERRFLSEMSHELRTPITICRGSVEVVAPAPSRDEVAEMREVLLSELDRMSRLVEDMTTLARAENPGFLRPEEVDVERFLAEVTSSAKVLLNGRLQLEWAPADDGVVSVDPQRLKQALLNLLQNAALHGPATGPVVLGLDREKDAWRFEVRDGGADLSAEEMRRVFEPFARGRTAAPGSGLGLAIVRGIAEAHGGSAGVESEPGRGATFWIRVPA